MNSKGSYFAENLACQNLGDCSLCDLPIIPEAKVEQEEPKNKRTKNTTSLKELLKKLKPENAA